MSGTNDFAFRIATVNGTGSASANSLLMQAIFRMGIPVTGKNIFPSNIQGLPTFYEIRVSKDGYTARPPSLDLVVALNERLQRANERLQRANERIEELERKLAARRTERVAEPFSLRAEEKRRQVRGRERRKWNRPLRRGRSRYFPPASTRATANSRTRGRCGGWKITRRCWWPTKSSAARR